MALNAGVEKQTFAHGRSAPPTTEVEFGTDEPESELFANILEARASLFRIISGAQQFSVTFSPSNTSLDMN
jgi:hypothetical protein